MSQINSSHGHRKTSSRWSQHSDVDSHPSAGFFANAHCFTIDNSTFIDGTQSNDAHFMELLAKNKITGAEFNSSERYPPPTCHPGTRLDTLGNIQSWMHNVAHEKKILWLNGPAGVGKSAITQAIADIESDSPISILGATLFFSRPNKRDDPQRVFITIAYQLAAKYSQYRRYVVELLTQDPTLVDKSLVEQFKKFIAQPFINKKISKSLDNTVLILLDGLDECQGDDVQCEIISLIGKFALQHPKSPLIWLITSRPEPHIRSTFLSRPIKSSYQEIVIPADSDQACLDVERYLRDKFNEIRERYSTSFPSPAQLWPTESHFVKIATWSSGLFIFPSLAIRFIEDREYANPVSQLNKVLNVIDSVPLADISENPFATLDALYTRILSGIHRRVLPTTMSILKYYVSSRREFVFACNFLGVTQADAYSALGKLHSVLKIPEPEDAYAQRLEPFHASFFDYLTSRSRSGVFHVDELEVGSWYLSLCVRVLLESHDPDASDIQVSRIKLSWPLGAHGAEIRANLYERSLLNLIFTGPGSVTDSIQTEFKRLSSFFRDLDFGDWDNPLPGELKGHGLGYFLYSGFVSQLEELGVIQSIPLQSLNFDHIRLNEITEIIRVFPLSQEPVDQEIPEQNWGPSYGVWYIPIRNTQFMNSQGEKIIDYDWHHKRVRLCEDTFWEAHVRKWLSTVTSTMPSHPITLFGKGEKSCAYIQFEISGELWIYALPYIQLA